MSISVMKLVWDASGLSSTETLALLELADHAHDPGDSVFPSVELTCRRTRLSERTIRGILSQMRKRGILIVVKRATWNKPTEYRIDLEKLSQLSGGAAVAPLPEGVQQVHTRGAAGAPLPPEGVQQVHTRGAAGAPKSSLNHHRELSVKKSSSSSNNGHSGTNGSGKKMMTFSPCEKLWLELTDKDSLTTAERECISRAGELVADKYGDAEVTRMFKYAAGNKLTSQRLFTLAGTWKSEAEKESGKREAVKEKPRKTYR